METLAIPKYVPPDFVRFFNFSILVNTPILIIIFIIFALCYTIVSVVLVYHWSRYGMKSPGIIIAEVLYLFVSLCLFFFASQALLYY